ncbi:MAG: sodium/solute symporter [Planctomycetaceae bacterium]
MFGHTHPLDLIIILLYLVIVTALGCLMSRRTKNAGEFMVAGGSLPGWVVGLSIIGTFVSSISFIANPGKTFADNWNPFVFSLSLPWAAWIATKWFVPWFRATGSVSAFEPLEQCFGAWARVYAALFNVLYHVGRTGTILYGVSLAVSTLLSIDVYWLILAIGILVIVYTLTGGIEAVIWTDVAQSLILVGGIIICAGLLVSRVPGGFFGIIDIARHQSVNKLSLGSTEFNGSTFAIPSFWMTLMFGLVINVQNFAADQTYVQRYFASDSNQSARKSVWMGALGYIPISAVLFFVGTALFAFYQTTGSGVLPADIKSDRVLPVFILSELPPGLSGLLIAAILAAAMSTVDSSLNSSATLLLCDVRQRFWGRTADASELRFLRNITIVLGIAGIGCAIAMTKIESMLDAWWKISGVLSGGTLGLMLLARFTRVRGTLVSLAAVIVGVTFIGAITLSSLDNPPPSIAWIRGYVHPLMAIVIGTAAVFVTGIALSGVRAIFQRSEDA